MKVIDPGHEYALQWLDGEPNVREKRYPNRLIFVKREGDGYPGNVGHHAGTTIQEVLRALIDRVMYLNEQVPHSANVAVVNNLQWAIWHLERRAAERHHRTFTAMKVGVELLPTCEKCLHVGCNGECH